MASVAPNPSFNHSLRRAEEPRNELEMDLDLIDPTQEGLTSSMYTLASTQSQFSNALDNWIRGGPSPIITASHANTAVQDSRAPMIQRSTQPPPLTTSGIWYILAMILPLFSINSTPRYWGCSPSTALHAAELLVSQICQLFAFVRRNLRRLAQDRVARDLFAMAMDVVLIVYALGFLLLSMYQASIFD